MRRAPILSGGTLITFEATQKEEVYLRALHTAADGLSGLRPGVSEDRLRDGLSGMVERIFKHVDGDQALRVDRREAKWGDALDAAVAGLVDLNFERRFMPEMNELIPGFGEEHRAHEKASGGRPPVAWPEAARTFAAERSIYQDFLRRMCSIAIMSKSGIDIQRIDDSRVRASKPEVAAPVVADRRAQVSAEVVDITNYLRPGVPMPVSADHVYHDERPKSVVSVLGAIDEELGFGVETVVAGRSPMDKDGVRAILEDYAAEVIKYVLSNGDGQFTLDVTAHDWEVQAASLTLGAFANFFESRHSKLAPALAECDAQRSHSAMLAALYNDSDLSTAFGSVKDAAALAAIAHLNKPEPMTAAQRYASA
jgi:hypothetical protein